MTDEAPSPGRRRADATQALTRFGRRRLAGPLLALATILLSLGAIEIALRVIGYRYTPLAFLPPPTRGDARLYHMGSGPGAADQTTMFDAELLWAPRPGWRLTPGSPIEINAQGLRGAGAPEPKAASDFVILALGDSNTAGPLDLPDHWPDDLQHLVDLNRSDRHVRVLNGGVYGYTSFQGLRRLRHLLRYEPDLVFVSFGANEGHTVRVPDEEYAARMGFLRRLDGLRLLPPLAQLVFDLADRVGGDRAPALRVAPEAHRRHLEGMVDLARRHRAEVVLLTRPYLDRRPTSDADWMFNAPRYRVLTREVARERGVACLDVYAAFAGRAELFTDESHFNRAGYQRMAELLLAHLARMNVVTSDRRRASALDLGNAPDSWPEIGAGWWPPEPWGTSALRGRWTGGHACVELERGGAEGGLGVDLTFHNPSNETELRVAANGTVVGSLRGANGRHRLRADLRAVPGRSLSVCLAVEPTFVPKEREPPSEDARTLGAFVHSLALEP